MAGRPGTVPRGEFSIVIAGLAVAAGSVEPRLAALAATYVLITVVTGPILARLPDLPVVQAVAAQPRGRPSGERAIPVRRLTARALTCQRLRNCSPRVLPQHPTAGYRFAPAARVRRQRCQTRARAEGWPVSVQESTFHGFANPVDPTPAELRAWAYKPDSVPLASMPPGLGPAGLRRPAGVDALRVGDGPACPARRFALHCLYIYAADGIRTNFRAHPKRRFRKLVEQAERDGDELMKIWAHNGRVLLARPDLFVYRDWCEGGLVRENRRLG